ncbi:tRNA (guanosine(46)-N7)-methyltransferase TrmB [Brucepastera parasyntrophica]|uniref:tRNA (guanosine(46)-N7)-methyltransferase TrmB n=1 Tax=Brucepastera parasyntrophica TaxID=2880008 RepID=UPI00210BCF05|nr:tRNA (guanosine(46)-N7)-methyltransferase TrmB [Brucepastera parasyntrophica]ULQ59789.1 tRNA (guanosine(46)-N7)-methyltransferase TrmB [Brucepastera parasyntrophica]
MNNSDETEPLQLRQVRTYVLRSGRMTEAQKRDYAILSARWCLPFQKTIINFTDVFENVFPTFVEIGFGMGRATAVIAAENPEKNYLGIEVHRAGVGRLLGEIENRCLTNIRIIEHDALEVLEYMIPDNSVAGFHVFFPDPWPKKRHHKRRLMQNPRTQLLARKLAYGGYIYMATDWEPYGEEAFIELTETPGLESMYEGFAPHQDWRPETRFEEKGKRENREIFELMFRKTMPEDESDGAE